MSKQNKVNKDHYVQRGRLTPDEIARQLARQVHLSSTRDRIWRRPTMRPAETAEPESTRPDTVREERD